MPIQCSESGRMFDDYTDGVFDDGEWISWEWINEQIYERERQAQFPDADPQLIHIFEELVDVAIQYKDVTGRYLPVFGELGELFAEMKFGIKRHKPGTPGSDGCLGNDFVEIKTITPEKRSTKIIVKRKGNFNKLVVVKIDAHFNFEARMLDRKSMSKGSGRFAGVSWSSMPKQSPNPDDAKTLEPPKP